MRRGVVDQRRRSLHPAHFRRFRFSVRQRRDTAQSRSTRIEHCTYVPPLRVYTDQRLVRRPVPVHCPVHRSHRQRSRTIHPMCNRLSNSVFVFHKNRNRGSLIRLGCTVHRCCIRRNRPTGIGRCTAAPSPNSSHHRPRRPHRWARRHLRFGIQTTRTSHSSRCKPACVFHNYRSSPSPLHPAWDKPSAQPRYNR